MSRSLIFLLFLYIYSIEAPLARVSTFRNTPLFRNTAEKLLNTAFKTPGGSLIQQRLMAIDHGSFNVALQKEFRKALKIQCANECATVKPMKLKEPSGKFVEMDPNIEFTLQGSEGEKKYNEWREYLEYVQKQCEENETVMGNPVSVIKNLARLAQQKLRYVRETNGADGWEFFKVIYLNFNENILFEFKDANRIVFLLSQLLEKSENLKELIQKSPVKEQLKVFLKETEDHMVTYYQSKRDEPVPHIIALKEALGVLKEKLQVKNEVVQEKEEKKEDV